MNQKTISTMIAEFLNKDFAQKTPLNNEDKTFIENYKKAISESNPAFDFTPAFKNVIRKEGRCGFAMAGSIDYLINTDSSHRYRVTIRTYWHQGIESGQFDNTVISEAGSRLNLGCTDSGYIPVATYSRVVVGEVQL